MANEGDCVDNAQRVNLTTPAVTLKINGMIIDMHKFAEAADALGADAWDILTIDGYRDDKGELIPDYDSVRIAKRHRE
jgi:hypothetical protein